MERGLRRRSQNLVSGSPYFAAKSALGLRWIPKFRVRDTVQIGYDASLDGVVDLGQLITPFVESNGKYGVITGWVPATFVVNVGLQTLDSAGLVRDKFTFATASSLASMSGNAIYNSGLANAGATYGDGSQLNATSEWIQMGGVSMPVGGLVYYGLPRRMLIYPNGQVQKLASIGQHQFSAVSCESLGIALRLL